MTAADEIREHQERCQPHLLTLRMLARGEEGLAMVVAEIGHATGAIIAEVQAASRVVLGGDGASYRDPGAGTFLRVRLNRLTASADEAIATARDGDSAILRRHLRRFEALTSAIWTVQVAVCAPAPPASRSPDAGIKQAPEEAAPEEAVAS